MQEKQTATIFIERFRTEVIPHLIYTRVNSLIQTHLKLKPETGEA
jgi:hypothetical protein